MELLVTEPMPLPQLNNILSLQGQAHPLVVNHNHILRLVSGLKSFRQSLAS